MKNILSLTIFIMISFTSEAYDLALVLSGGGARSVASIGVIEVLEENGIKPDIIVGTSGGALVGALYADKGEVASLKSIFHKIKKKDLIDVSWVRGFVGLFGFDVWMVDSSPGEKYLSNHMKSEEFHNLKIPFVAVVADIDNGEVLGINDGKIAHAVRASCSVPGFFKPVYIDGRLYVDGGVFSPTPVDIARKLGAKKVIAIDTILPEEMPKATNSLKILYRAFTMQFRSLNNFVINDADIVIKPEIKNIRLFDYHRSKELIDIGRAAAIKSLPEIEKQLHSHK